MTGNWKIVGAFLKSIVVGVFLSTVILGVIGFLLAGAPGLVNMAVWGAVLGLAGGVMSGLAAMSARYSQEIGGNFSRWHEREETRKS
jgi:hypothetical protein